MSKPREFWISKGSSCFADEGAWDDETLEEIKMQSGGFYDLVSPKDTIEGGIHVIEKSAYTALEEQNEKLKDELKGYKMGADIEAREGDIARAQARKLADHLELAIAGLHGANVDVTFLINRLKDLRGKK